MDEPAKRNFLFGMSDEKLADALAALPQEGRFKVLIAVAIGWQELCERHRLNALTQRT